MSAFADNNLNLEDKSMNKQKMGLASALLFGFSSIAFAAPPNPTASDSDGNTAGGTFTLNNTTGVFNTGFGYQSLLYSTTANDNAAFGAWSQSRIIGGRNTAVGAYALHGSNIPSNNTGHDNTALGYSTLYNTSTGSNNAAVGGFKALYLNTTGSHNTASGTFALYSNTTGNYNSAYGFQTLKALSIGAGNLALGKNAGVNLTQGYNNIYLVAPGAKKENGVIKIGNSNNHKRAYIAGIRGVKTNQSNAVQVVIDSNGQLGTINSSARFKKDIHDMADASRKLMQLRPVTYHYKDSDGNGENPIEYGLIAEEVEKIYPDLVAHDAEGKVETVQYRKLIPMLLNELQSQNQLMQQQAKEIAALRVQVQKVDSLEQKVNLLQTQNQAIAVLTARLNRLEGSQQMANLSQ
jgi:hypothetical protein